MLNARSQRVSASSSRAARIVRRPESKMVCFISVLLMGKNPLTYEATRRCDWRCFANILHQAAATENLRLQPHA